MPSPSPTTPPTAEAGPDTDAAVARAYLRDAKGKPCRPYGPDERGRWLWKPDGFDSDAPIPAFSTEWDAAGQLAGYVAGRGYVVGVFIATDGVQVRLDRGYGASISYIAPTFPLALCRAALAVAGAEKARSK